MIISRFLESIHNSGTDNIKYNSKDDNNTFSMNIWYRCSLYDFRLTKHAYFIHCLREDSQEVSIKLSSMNGQKIGR